MKPTTCGDAGGRKADGTPCGLAIDLSEGGLCVHHDPERREEAKALHVAGGKGRARARRKAAETPKPRPEDLPPPPDTMEDAVAWSAWTMERLACGQIDARTAHEIGYLINAFKGAVEKRDLLREIEQLRGEVAAARPGARPKVI